ncbi:MAG: helix-turn-helix domain-containing protein, partial [Actinomycetota bacterium]|nr:helix-turn-helix domain-containing protein [Actinomycetota bacterium]
MLPLLYSDAPRQHPGTQPGTGRRPVVTASTQLHELPEVLTIEEAAVVLRISRTSAYELARVWRATGGAEGLPVIPL